jgi:MoaA/NifB/PqqE/SkfB family radical SAM enzyme
VGDGRTESVKFMRSRDPQRLKVTIYGTVTRRTLQDIDSIIEFAAENRLDTVQFYRYSPIEQFFEEEPTSTELEKLNTSCSPGSPIIEMF